MGKDVFESQKVLPQKFRKYGIILIFINTSMNILGWGTLVCFLLLVQILPASLNFVLVSLVFLLFLVPSSLIANLIIILLVFMAGIKHYGNFWKLLKKLPWKNKWFILSCASTQLYLVGCALFVVLYHYATSGTIPD